MAHPWGEARHRPSLRVRTVSRWGHDRRCARAHATRAVRAAAATPTTVAHRRATPLCITRRRGRLVGRRRPGHAITPDSCRTYRLVARYRGL